MAKGPRYKVRFRRRREGKTNYYRRKRLLLSRKPRLVIRKTNGNTIVQLVEAHVQGDKTLASAISLELKKLYGWNISTKNIPAAYLTGLLAGLRAIKKGYTEAVLDIGLHLPIKGGRIYAALKGVIDAGLNVPHSPDVFPDESRIKGEHIVKALDHFKKSEGFMFAQYYNRVKGSEIPKLVENIKEMILAGKTAEKTKAKKKAKVGKEAKEEAPKKRGRKKKTEEAKEEAKEEAPKKRGRKKKTEEAKEEAKEEAPKKRGRKKKTEEGEK